MHGLDWPEIYTVMNFQIDIQTAECRAKASDRCNCFVHHCCMRSTSICNFTIFRGVCDVQRQQQYLWIIQCEQRWDCILKFEAGAH